MKLNPIFPILFLAVFSEASLLASPVPQGFYTPDRDGQTSTDGEVLKFDTKTGQFISTIVPSLGVDIIQGMTLGPDNNLYLSVFDTVSNLNGRVLRYDLTGNFIDEFVQAGEGGLGSPVGLMFGPDGNLYVTSNAPDLDEVLRFDGEDGSFIDVAASGLSTPQDIVFGTDGLMYVSNGNVFSSSVYRFNPSTTALVDQFVPTGSGGLSAPTGMAFGPDGDLYVVSFPNNAVLRFNGLTGAFIDEFLNLDALGSYTPTAIVFGPDGNLFVNGRSLTQPETGIYRFDATTGDLIDTFIPIGGGGLGVFNTGMLFVDTGCSRYEDGGLGNRCFSASMIPEPMTLLLLISGMIWFGVTPRSLFTAADG